MGPRSSQKSWETEFRHLVNFRVLLWAETVAGRPGGRPAVALDLLSSVLALDLLSWVRLGALPQGWDSCFDSET